MSRPALGLASTLLALILAGGSQTRAQILPQLNSEAEDAAAAIAIRQNERIISLLEQLSEQARQSDDLSFTVRAQAQAATLMWPHRPDRARAIYRRAFQALGVQSIPRSPDAPGDKPSRPAITPGLRLQLRSELLNSIAARDPELADELARSLAELNVSKDACQSCDYQSGAPNAQAGAQAREGVERREMLINVALRIVEREPEQAMALAQMSFSLGLSPNFSRLLMMMRSADPGLASLLFSSALARLEVTPIADLADVHILGSYLVSAGSSTREAMGRTMVTRFLNLAFSQIAMRAERAGSLSGGGLGREDSADLYFVGKHLKDLFARYQPDRLEPLKQKISQLSEAGGQEQVIEAVTWEGSGPAEIEVEARASSDAHERDALYARAALGWLAQGEPRRAQTAAFAIADPEMRDRVLGQLARKRASDGQLEDAVALARRIEDHSSRVEQFVMLASSALAAGDKQRANELVSEAEASASKLRNPSLRARSLLKVASALSGYDTSRAFEIMHYAVKSINDTPAQPEETSGAGASRPGGSATSPKVVDHYGTLLDSPLAALARVDFERALLVAQQIAEREASIAAQLAVCRGGLSASPPTDPTLTADEVASDANAAASRSRH